MDKEMERVCKEVLRLIEPTSNDEARIQALAKKLQKKVLSASRECDVDAFVRVEGSVAKGTWLREEPDVDVFIYLSTSIPFNSLGNISLKIARKATEGSKQVERFAEHPYLEAFFNGVRVNIVPCYDVKPGRWLSSTDRTPFHTNYIKKHFDSQMRRDVRLLKMFMKGIGVYGAEIKIGGFSGYLCELLILYYNSFIETLEAFVRYKHRILIDIENYYGKKELQHIFKEPLVIVDPVDSRRNVASAVQTQKLYSFVAASRALLRKPNLKFFFPPKIELFSIEDLKRKFEKQNSAFVFLTFKNVDSVPDVLWGQLYKSLRSLRKLIELNNFEVLRDFAWSNEGSLNVFVFELEKNYLPKFKRHLGPPLEKERECEKFLAKYIDNLDVISGPYIESGRWLVKLKRKYTDVTELLNEKLKEGGRNVGIAKQISQVLCGGFEIYVNDEVVDIYKLNNKFAEFLTSFLYGRPRWLETIQT